jgi:hypothetical protein
MSFLSLVSFMRELDTKPNDVNLTKLAGFFRGRAVSRLLEKPAKKDAGCSDLVEVAEFLRCSALAKLSDGSDTIIKTAASVYATKLLTKSLPQLLMLARKQHPQMDLSALGDLRKLPSNFAGGNLRHIDGGYDEALKRHALVKILGGKYDNVETALSNAIQKQYARSTIGHNVLEPMKPTVSISVPENLKDRTTVFRGLSNGSFGQDQNRFEFLQGGKTLKHTGNPNMTASYAALPETGADYARPLRGQRVSESGKYDFENDKLYSSAARGVPRRINPLATDQQFLIEANIKDIDPKLLGTGRELKSGDPAGYLLNKTIDGHDPWLVSPKGVPWQETRTSGQQQLAHQMAVKNNLAYEMVGDSYDVPVQKVWKITPEAYPKYGKWKAGLLWDHTLMGKTVQKWRQWLRSIANNPNDIEARKAWWRNYFNPSMGVKGDKFAPASGATQIEFTEPVDNAVQRSSSFFNRYGKSQEYLSQDVKARLNALRAGMLHTGVLPKPLEELRADRLTNKQSQSAKRLTGQ